MNKVNLPNLNVGDLFSFKKKSSVHMLLKQGLLHIEYKSYSDGKIRSKLKRDIDAVYARPEWDSIYEKKWFMTIKK